MSTWQIVRDGERIALAGDLRIADAAPIWRQLRTVARDPGPQLDLDLARAAAVDGAIMSLLVDLRTSLTAHGVRSEIVGTPAPLQPIVHLYRGDEPPPAPTAAPPRERAITRLGAATARLLDVFRGLATFTGELIDSVARILRRPATASWRELPVLVARAGTDGLLIVLLLDFLVGFIMAFQSTASLKTYGANIYVADIVGVSITRELGPLMTAIIISGRSGAAYAAELGTMRVSEEIDALRTMGFSPVPYLVVPRMLALAIVAPVLTLLGDVVGVAGGAVVGATSLDVTPYGYLAELRIALVLSDVWTGLVKSFAFGLAIAFIGCRQGLAATGAASGVGRSTTTTVVYCLFTIVIIDTLFTVVFRGVGA